MAIFHASTKAISRSSGRSAVAACAYRHALEITDDRTGHVHDYTRKGGVLASHIVTASDMNIARSELWNAAEAAEKRKDSRVAREWIVALPAELDAGQREALVLEFASIIAGTYECAVDVALHAPSREGDNRNFHAHLLCTTRKIEALEDGGWRLGEKTDLELSDTKLGKLGLANGATQITEMRMAWEMCANIALEHAGHEERIDSRSLEAQGIDRAPTIHLGPVANDMERKGKVSDRGEQNRATALENAERASLSAQIIDLKKVREERRLEGLDIHELEAERKTLQNKLPSDYQYGSKEMHQLRNKLEQKIRQDLVTAGHIQREAKEEYHNFRDKNWFRTALNDWGLWKSKELARHEAEYKRGWELERQANLEKQRTERELEAATKRHNELVAEVRQGMDKLTAIIKAKEALEMVEIRQIASGHNSKEIEQLRQSLIADGISNPKSERLIRQLGQLRDEAAIRENPKPDKPTPPRHRHRM